MNVPAKNHLLCAVLVALLSIWVGAAPQLSDAGIERHTTAVRGAADGPTAGFSVDTSNRNDVLSLYHRVYLASESFADTHGWTGDVDTCTAGATSADLKEDTRRRVNYYRAMAGLNADISFDTEKSRKAQEAALIMSRQGGLSHNPNADFPGNPCLSNDGQEAAASSNLSLGNFGPDAINGQMDDDGASNGVVGHRRWILYSRAQEMGTGDVPDAPGRWATNSLWVIGNFSAAPSPAPEIAWPPAGYVPYHLAPNESHSFPRWSYAYPGADFSQATVTMTQGETNVPVTLDLLVNGFGDNTLVWRPSGIPSTPPVADTTYTVSIAGIGNAPFTERSYDVILIDPFDLGTELIVTGNATPGAGVASTYSFDPILGSEGYDVTIASYSDAAWSEGAEGTPVVIDGTEASYSLVSSHTVAAGSRAFHLATPDFGSTEHVVVDRNLVPQASSQVRFRYRRLFMHPDTKLRVQLSADGGQSFSTIHSIDGNNFGSSAQWDPASFIGETVAIPGAFHDRQAMLRFMLDNTGVAFIGVTANIGIYVDEILVDNCLEITDQAVVSLEANASSFSYTPAAVGEQRLLMAGVRLGERFWGYGPALAVESVSALAVAGLSPVAGTIDVATTASLHAIFSEAVIRGTGNIVIRRVDNGTEIGSIDVTSASVSVAGTAVTIIPPFPLPHASELEVEFAPGVLQNSGGASFVGFDAHGPWRFTTVAAPTPANIVSLLPADDATDVGADATLALGVSFDKAVRRGSGAITVHRATDGSPLGSVNVQSTDVHIDSGDVTVMAPFTVTVNTDYYVTFPTGVFVDFDGLEAPGVTGADDWNFSVSSLAFTLDLKREWNLLSLPIIPDTTDVELLGGNGRVFTFQDGQFTPATSLQVGQGYFVFNPGEPRQIVVRGTAGDLTPTRVQPGWSLLGITATPPYESRSISDAMTPEPSSAWHMQRGVYRDAVVLQPGLGYLVYLP